MGLHCPFVYTLTVFFVITALWCRLIINNFQYFLPRLQPKHLYSIIILIDITVFIWTYAFTSLLLLFFSMFTGYNIEVTMVYMILIHNKSIFKIYLGHPHLNWCNQLLAVLSFTAVASSSAFSQKYNVHVYDLNRGLHLFCKESKEVCI